MAIEVKYPAECSLLVVPRDHDYLVDSAIQEGWARDAISVGLDWEEALQIVETREATVFGFWSARLTDADIAAGVDRSTR